MSSGRSHQKPRLSQRQPRACVECTRRKTRCDKQSPCGRCVRLSKQCSREVIRISKADTVHRDELEFLDRICEILESPRSPGDALSAAQARRSLLLYGSAHQPVSRELTKTAHVSSVQAATDQVHLSQNGSSSVPGSTVLEHPPAIDGQNSSSAISPSIDSSLGSDHDELRVVHFHKIEWLAWGRYRGDCFPHVDCQCRSIRPYAEVVSIIADPEWPGYRHTSPATNNSILPPVQAQLLVQFHLEHILWHHSAFHAPTFLVQCEQYWTSGTVVHPLWLSLYYSVTMVSAWTALNCTGLWTGGHLESSTPSRLFRAMVDQLYRGDFARNHSLFSIQAIVLSTRVAHNLDQTDLNATLVGAAIRMAHCMGLHRISSHHVQPPVDTARGWFQSVETEVGRRCWSQLVIQDYFQIPVTGSYRKIPVCCLNVLFIHPSQTTTDLPINCHDEDMVPRENEAITITSYPRTLLHIAFLMPRLLDGLGSAKDRPSLADTYKVVVSCEVAMREVVREMPSLFMKTPLTAPDTEGHLHTPWLPAARRSLALSAADKIIMIHRPVLYHAFQVPALARARKCCVSAAQTIFREFETISQEGVIPIWTHSAFCVTAAVVIGLELLFRERHTDDQSRYLRHMMTTAAERLRTRQSDTIAERCATLIDTILSVEEELVIKVMRQSLTSSGSLHALQTAIVNDMVSRNEIMAKFMLYRPSGGSPPSSYSDMSQINSDLMADPSWAENIAGDGGADPDLAWLSQGDFSFLNTT